MTNATYSPVRADALPRFGSHNFKVLAFRLTLRAKMFTGRISETLVVWQRRWETRQQIRQLDDRQIADVGLSRADLEREARKPFWTA